MRTNSASKNAVPFINCRGEEACHVIFLPQTFEWVFLLTAFTALVYGTLHLLLGFGYGVATFLSALSVLLLIFSPDRRLLDWCGLCFTAVATSFFAIGRPSTSIMGVIVAIFAFMTLFDKDMGFVVRKRFTLFVAYLLVAGLVFVIFRAPNWAIFPTFALYMFLYVVVRLMPIGLAARKIFMNDDL